MIPKAKQQGILFKTLSIVGVSSYLIVAYLYLRIRGQLKPPCSFIKLMLFPLRRSYKGYLKYIDSEIGHCFTCALPAHLISDLDGGSRLRVFEDGFPLAAVGSGHDDVRRVGRGAFSHWGRFIYFSTSDNSDPRTNGRVYSVREM